MNIIWAVETALVPSGKEILIDVTNDELWEGVIISKPTRSFSRLGNTTNISYNSNVFNDIPTEWFVLEN